MLLLCCVVFSTAPSAGPASVTAGTVITSSITVQWEEVPCLHRNGEITGYTVVARTSGEDDRVINVDDHREAIISGLNRNTQYTVHVTASNSAGTGLASSIDIKTAGVCMWAPGGGCSPHLIFIPIVEFIASVSSSTDSLTIFLELFNGVTATAFTISYSNTNTDCFTDSAPDTAGTETMYTLTGLEEGTEYSITVTATLTGGRGTEQDTTNATTRAAGESTSQRYLSLLFCPFHNYSSICPSLFCESVNRELHYHYCQVGASRTMCPPEWGHHWLLSEIWGGGD